MADLEELAVVGETTEPVFGAVLVDYVVLLGGDVVVDNAEEGGPGGG